MPEPRSCNICGCTDAAACPGGCAWVDFGDGEDLCTSCVLGAHLEQLYEDALRSGVAKRPHPGPCWDFAATALLAHLGIDPAQAAVLLAMHQNKKPLPYRRQRRRG